MFDYQMFDHDKIDFEVEKFSLDSYDGNAVNSDIGVGLRRKDNKRALALVSDAYEPVQYKDIVTGVQEAIGLSDMDLADAKYETNVYDSGARLELRAKFPAHEIQIDKGDTVIPEFVFRTSHNRTWANNGMMGLWRGYCWNTLVSGDKLAYVYGRHTKNFNVLGFASKIEKAAEYIAGGGLRQMRNWYHTDVSRDNVINLFTHTLAKKTNNVSRKVEPNKVMLSNLMKTFDQENRHLHGRANYEKYATRNHGTLWTAYQAATWWSSHDKDGGEGSRPSHTVIGGREDKVRKMLQSPQWMQLAA
jgi:hypothetical protein